MDTEHPVELKYTPEVGRPTKTCHRPLQDPLNLDVIQTLPKTNSILNIISNDLRIQVRLLTNSKKKVFNSKIKHFDLV